MVTTFSATSCNSDVVIPILSANAAELSNSLEESELSVATVHGSILVIWSGVTVSGKPSAINTEAGSVATDTTVLKGVTATACEGSAGTSAIRARLGSSLLVKISVPPIDRTLCSKPDWASVSASA